jgi:hypothetical protein
MNDRLRLPGFFHFGLAVSLSWHFVWAFVFVPSKPSFVFLPAEGQAIFLGSLLKGPDLAPASKTAGSNTRPAFIVRRQDDFSRKAYFEKTSVLVYKPKPVYGTQSVQAPVASLLARPAETAEPKMDITFGFADAANYLEYTNFSDLKNLVSKEDLAALIEFKVLVSRDGQVEMVKKINSSGDPAVDLSIMRQLKKAILKNPPNEESWVRIRIRIR